MRRLFSFILLGIIFSFQNPTQVFAQVIYVDSLQGDDIAEGTSPTPVDLKNGPVRTIRRGLQLLTKGGTLNLANNGTPYYESLELNRGMGGFLLHPTLIKGNGSELNGSFPVHPLGWRKAGDHIWKFTPVRKGNYLLILDNKALPETPVPPGGFRFPDLPEGHWAAWRGSIYFRPGKLEVPSELNLWFAVRSVGVTLYEVKNVVVNNLKVRHFRIDGINAHDRATNIRLENVTAEENGRAGVVASGSSVISLEKPTIKNNRKYSVLITERATIQIDDETNVAPAPTLAD